MSGLKFIILGSFITVGLPNLHAQEFTFQREIDTIPVIVASAPLARPFNGGIGYSAPVFADIDADGDFDLFFGERDGDINFYRNNGSAASAFFAQESVPSGVVNVGLFSTPTFADIDNDGDLDFFAGASNGNINFFRNIGTAANPSFTQETENFASIDIGFASVPEFADIDADGDLDLFIGETGGNINFYRNTGTATNPTFTLVTENFESINIGGRSAPTFADIDADGDFDLYVGGEAGTISFYRNIGTAANATFTLETTNLTSDIGSFANPALTDIDDDNDLDLFEGGFGGNITFFRNTGSTSNAAFTFETSDFAPIDVIFVNFLSAPNFADLDNDGDFDMFVGGWFGTIYFFENIGSPSNPRFNLATSSFSSIDIGLGARPIFVDIDSDNDFDLFIGEEAGNVNFYRNIGSIANHSFTLGSEDFVSFNVGERNSPHFADIDNDGDFDLFVGEGGGNLNLFRNVGSAANPNLTLETENFQSIDLVFDSAPTMVDIDDDGDLDLFMGGGLGNITLYRNTGTATNPSFVLESVDFQSIDVGVSSTPAFVDIDSDGDLDLFIGDFDGGLQFYRNVTGASDQTPPQIAHSPPSLASSGQSQAVSATLTDNVGIQSATLFYRRGGSSAFTSVSMTNTSGNIYEASIPASDVTSRGVEYYMSASDGQNTVYDPPTNFASNPHRIRVQVDNLQNPDQQPAGSVQTAYRQISIPLQLTQVGVEEVLFDDLGDYDDTNWRLFRSENGSLFEYPDSRATSFSPGKVFWLIVRESGKTIDAGSGTSVSTANPFTITLQPGWNDVGVPFDFPVNWSDVQKSSQQFDGPYFYQGDWALPNTIQRLEPWKGYAVNNLSTGPISIAIPPLAADATSVAKRSFESEKSTDAAAIQIKATCEEARDEMNFLGFREDATKEKDPFDYSEPPTIGQYVSLHFPHDHWSLYPGKYATDFRPHSEDGDIWNLAVETNIPQSPIHLSWESVNTIPHELHAVLIDQETGFRVDLRHQEKYWIANSAMRRFAIVIGTDEFIEEQMDEVATSEEFTLQQNYPNPFNPATIIRYTIPKQARVKIDIFDILGQKVHTLLNQEQPAGHYSVTWDGHNDRGQLVASGVYVYQIRADNFTQSRKMIFLR